MSNNPVVRALTALIVGTEEQEQIVSGDVHATIRAGFRDYIVGDRMILCSHLENFAILTNVESVAHVIFRDLTEDQLVAANLPTNIDEALAALQAFYPGLTLGSEVSFLSWGNLVTGEVTDTDAIGDTAPPADADVENNAGAAGN